ncbi:MAG: rRNA maturation RNase YbeY [Verrucomicrobiota bacterium]|jgi:probable rRNA maturation factor
MARKKIVSSRPPPLLQVCSRQKTRRLNLPLLRQLVRRLLQEWPPRRGQTGAKKVTPQSWVAGRALRTRRGGQRSARPTVAGPPKTDRQPKESLRAGGQLGVYFIHAAEMARLNEQFLGHAGSTDVITFDYAEGAEQGGSGGEIFISVDDAVASAPRFRATWQSELARYLVHGMLHLRGYDDRRPAARREMKKEENRVLKALSRRLDWGKLERVKNVVRPK